MKNSLNIRIGNIALSGEQGGIHIKEFYESPGFQLEKKEFCFSLAYWIQSSEGWDLKFVGNRPFALSGVNWSTFWLLAQIGQKLFDNDFLKDEV